MSAGNQRRTIRAASDHGGGKSLGLVPTFLFREAPETTHILAQLSEHQIGTVATEIALRRILFRRRQFRCAADSRIEHWTVGIESVFVFIPEQELAGGDEIAVFEIV